MSKPVIVTVDDEPQVSDAIERDLRKHYRKDYQIIKNSSGPQALETVRQLKQRNTPIALFLADQRMPNMGGTEFLSEAMKFYPDARKVLLTAYADTDAAISAINDVGLDYYLMKPWDPPEKTFIPYWMIFSATGRQRLSYLTTVSGLPGRNGHRAAIM